MLHVIRVCFCQQVENVKSYELQEVASAQVFSEKKGGGGLQEDLPQEVRVSVVSTIGIERSAFCCIEAL